MHLVELIAQTDTDPALLDALETFLVTTLGKGVVRAKDTPNFVANRVGVFSMLATMRHTETLRPRLRRRRRADRAGDRPRRRARPTAPATSSASTPWRTSSRRCTTRCPTIRGTCFYRTPPVLAALVAQGALGQKTQAGFFRKAGKEIQVLDPAARDYRPSTGAVDPEVAEILAIKHPGEKFAKLRAHRRTRRRSSCGRSSATSSTTARVHLAAIADNARDVDLAIRWGFGWRWVRSRPGRRRAGRRSPAGSPRTSPPARRWPTCRCPRG